MNTKYLLLHLLCALNVYAQEPDNISLNPNIILDDIRNQINAKDADLARNQPLANNIQNLAHSINQDIINAESRSWLEPSPERLAVIEKWGKILQPYTSDLLKLAIPSEYYNTGAGMQCRSLLDFAPSNENFASEVRKYIGTDKIDSSVRAADLLYQHRLLSDSDRQILKQLMDQVGNDDEKFQYALKLYEYGIHDWEDYIIEATKIKLRAEPMDGDLKQYTAALGAVKLLGGKAIDVVPELESILKSPVIINSGYRNHFENARDIASGRKPVLDGPSARNGSGPIGNWYQNLDASTKKDIAHKNNSSQKFLNYIWCWVITTIILVAASGLIFFKRKFKK